ncbi:MAG: hypothetical protein LBT56_02455 [Prevotellaceae bacterium]|jgi:hypothetical protein|nr:hypothetical protein [Prevotellaceae bacterium]
MMAINSGYAALKEKESNVEYELKFSEKKADYSFFTVAPSVSFGYKLSERFFINANITASYYKSNAVIEKKRTNLVTKESQKEFIDYRKIFTLSLGTGLVYVLKYKKIKPLAHR